MPLHNEEVRGRRSREPHCVLRNPKLSFPLRLLPSIPGPRSAHSPNFPHYLVQGGLRRQLQGHWLYRAPLSQDVLEAPLQMGEGLWGPGLAPLRGCPSQTTGWPLLKTLLTPHPLLTPRESAHLLSWSQGGRLSLEGLHQLCSSHGAHQDLGLWTGREGDGKSHVVKKELLFPGLL